jgi:ADP-heptose:LPS heptosyltransferase
LEWIKHYAGHRLYATRSNGRWHWDLHFRATPGEIFFSPEETEAATRASSGFILIEPSVKMSAPNKQWPRQSYEAVARELVRLGHRVAQFSRSATPLASGVELLPSGSFRHALSVLARSSLYIGPEGGLHHGAAALKVPAVVIFGGFISPASTGYDCHINLSSGGDPCGTIGRRCSHCMEAMAAISPKTVIDAALEMIDGKIAKSGSSR